MKFLHFSSLSDHPYVKFYPPVTGNLLSLSLILTISHSPFLLLLSSLLLSYLASDPHQSWPIPPNVGYANDRREPDPRDKRPPYQFQPQKGDFWREDESRKRDIRRDVEAGPRAGERSVKRVRTEECEKVGGVSPSSTSSLSSSTLAPSEGSSHSPSSSSSSSSSIKAVPPPPPPMPSLQVQNCGRIVREISDGRLVFQNRNFRET